MAALTPSENKALQKIIRKLTDEKPDRSKLGRETFSEGVARCLQHKIFK